MKRTLSSLVVAALVAAATLTGIAAGDDPSWSITADIDESCNCNPACPCVFGSKSTNEHCEGSRLVEIKTGVFDLALVEVDVGEREARASRIRQVPGEDVVGRAEFKTPTAGLRRRGGFRGHLCGPARKP